MGVSTIYNANQLRATPPKGTFKAKTGVVEGSKQHQLKRYASAVLGSGNLRQAVVLPEGEDRDEWLAVHSKACLL